MHALKHLCLLIDADVAVLAVEIVPRRLAKVYSQTTVEHESSVGHVLDSLCMPRLHTHG
jgi:hypothetical protein